jgi:transcriptional regulator with XRE-family HTH domain
VASKKTSLASRSEKKMLKEFGKKVKALRLKKKLTVYDLTGDDMPIKTRQHWQLIERGQKNINITTLFRVSNTLGIAATELIKGL